MNTADEMRISVWSSDVCSSDLLSGVMVTDHTGQREIGADAYVDASGEATLAFLACTPMSVDSRTGDHVQPASLPVCIGGEIGRTQRREGVCQYVCLSVVAVSLNNIIS